MYEENNINAKMQADKLAYAQQTNAQPIYAGTTLDGACRASLRERVESQLYRATQEGRKAARLHELQELLNKNPEVARILDLIEEVRG